MRNIVALIAILLVSVSVFGCDNKATNTQQSQQKDTTPEISLASNKLDFNTSDKSITANNNLVVAADRLKGEQAGSLLGKSEKVVASKLTKSPYSSLGKIFRISGRVYKVEELPPSLGLKGSWGEILMLVGNPNSPLGATTVDFIYNGDISQINSGQSITCSGYFVGTFDSPNAMGGTVEAVVLVGNSVKHL